MVVDNLKQVLVTGLAKLHINSSEKQQQQLIDYLALLSKWNRRFNLSGIRDPIDMVALHLFDSLSLIPWLDGKTIMDIGSGAGLPGIPLAITNTDKQFILLDSNGKKTRFLLQAKLALGLENIHIENNRIEHYQSKGQLDIVTCRAFSSLANTIKMSEALLAKGAVLLAMKGRYPEKEISEIPQNYQITRSMKVAVPGIETERCIIEIKRNLTDNL
jgi:16S rRNA (guanine527-N7)-methyltransferase